MMNGMVLRPPFSLATCLVSCDEVSSPPTPPAMVELFVYESTKDEQQKSAIAAPTPTQSF